MKYFLILLLMITPVLAQDGMSEWHTAVEKMVADCKTSGDVPLSVCDCLKKKSWNLFTEADVKKINAGDAEAIIAGQLSMRMIGSACVQEYKESQK